MSRSGSVLLDLHIPQTCVYSDPGLSSELPSHSARHACSSELLYADLLSCGEAI